MLLIDLELEEAFEKNAGMFSDQAPPIKLQKLETRNGMDIWEVDGAVVRQFEDDQFTNFGHHFRFPFIPKNEIWLDIEAHPDEREFFINHALIERFLMLRGEPYPKSVDLAGEFEREERKRNPQGPGQIHFEKTQTLPGGIDVWVVDGRRVREMYYQDFTAGGHHYVYKWIPEKEIWLDDDIPQSERPFVLAHEWIERVYMSKGDTYPVAHRKASSFERALRDSPDLLESVPALMQTIEGTAKVGEDREEFSPIKPVLGGAGLGALLMGLNSYLSYPQDIPVKHLIPAGYGAVIGGMLGGGFNAIREKSHRHAEAELEKEKRERQAREYQAALMAMGRKEGNS